MLTAYLELVLHLGKHGSKCKYGDLHPRVSRFSVFLRHLRGDRVRSSATFGKCGWSSAIMEISWRQVFEFGRFVGRKWVLFVIVEANATDLSITETKWVFFPLTSETHMFLINYAKLNSWWSWQARGEAQCTCRELLNQILLISRKVINQSSECDNRLQASYLLSKTPTNQHHVTEELICAYHVLSSTRCNL